MNRRSLIRTLDKATDGAAAIAIKNGELIRISKKAAMIGDVVVQQNINGLYDIIVKNRITYTDITLFDIALIIAQKYTDGEKSVIKKILNLESIYSKHRMDMIHYLHCLKGAKKSRDTDRMAILEDKFQLAEIQAKNARDKISVFRRIPRK